MSPVVQPGGAVWAVATRISLLDVNGFVDSNAPTFTTNTLVKATLTPVYESGDAIAVKTAAGELGVYAVHGDILKWGTISLELATPDNQLEQIICNGTTFSSSAAALGAPTAPTGTGQTTLGTLAAGIYSYALTQYNSFGESIASTQVNVTTTGSTGAVVLTGMPTTAGAIGWRLYGRIGGGMQLLGSGSVISPVQATSAASGTGAVTSLSVTALTDNLPVGTQFQITGDTNSPKIVFTTTQSAGLGATALSVTASQSVTTTIAAANIVPCFADYGTLPLGAAPPITDYTVGPGTGTGYQMPAPGTTAAPNGVSLELWQKRIINGFQASDYPYWYTVLPRVANMHIMPRDYTNANMVTTMEGNAFRNPSWGSGGFGTWPWDSTQMSQRALCGAAVVPVAGFASVPAAVTS